MLQLPPTPGCLPRQCLDSTFCDKIRGNSISKPEKSIFNWMRRPENSPSICLYCSSKYSIDGPRRLFLEGVSKLCAPPPKKPVPDTPWAERLQRRNTSLRWRMQLKPVPDGHRLFKAQVLVQTELRNGPVTGAAVASLGSGSWVPGTTPRGLIHQGGGGLTKITKKIIKIFWNNSIKS